MSASDVLIQNLNDKYAQDRGVEFLPACTLVIQGQELEDTGNKKHGKNVYVATGARYQTKEGERVTGRMIDPQHTEVFKKCELRCERQGRKVSMAVYTKSGQQISRTLRCQHDSEGQLDEGELAWFGPVEDICTPWSDNDPSQCQVISVQVLREYARNYPSKKNA